MAQSLCLVNVKCLNKLAPDTQTNSLWRENESDSLYLVMEAPVRGTQNKIGSNKHKATFPKEQNLLKLHFVSQINVS